MEREEDVQRPRNALRPLQGGGGGGALKVGGVERVDVDLDSKLVTVVGSRLEDGALVTAIGEAGYEAEEVAV